jgi:histidinol-phosphate aminotransferase
MTKIAPQPGIMSISPYVGGASKVEGVENIVKLSSNENPFGPSEAAKEAFRRAAYELHRYPSTDHASLRMAIGEVYGLDPARIVCGVGSDEILALLCQAYAGPGDEVIHTEHGFALYKIGALTNGATPVEVRERERVTDVDAILAACTDKTRLVFVANPNNPTGTMIGTAELGRLADGLPDQAMLVIDGAYAEYVEGYDGGAALVEARDNVIMTRTFSKLYGLGGLRVGWGYAPGMWSMCSTASARLSTSATQRWPRLRPRCAIPTGPRNAASTTPACAPGWPRRWRKRACPRTPRPRISSSPALPIRPRRRPAMPSSRKRG